VRADPALVDARVRVVDVVEDGVEVRTELAADSENERGDQQRERRAAHRLERTSSSRETASSESKKRHEWCRHNERQVELQ
jgi:hypothetical protein